MASGLLQTQDMLNSIEAQYFTLRGFIRDTVNILVKNGTAAQVTDVYLAKLDSTSARHSSSSKSHLGKHVLCKDPGFGSGPRRTPRKEKNS